MMKKNPITVLIKKVDEPIYEAVIEDCLDSYYKIIDCDCIEFYYPFEERPNICCIIDECGRLNRKLIAWRIPKSTIGLNGTIIFAKDDGRGNTIGLNEEDIAFIKKQCPLDHYRTFESDFDCSFTFIGW